MRMTQNLNYLLSDIKVTFWLFSMRFQVWICGTVSAECGLPRGDLIRPYFLHIVWLSSKCCNLTGAWPNINEAKK